MTAKCFKHRQEQNISKALHSECLIILISLSYHALTALKVLYRPVVISQHCVEQSLYSEGAIDYVNIVKCFILKVRSYHCSGLEYSEG